jgi:hypothetical protein
MLFLVRGFQFRFRQVADRFFFQFHGLNVLFGP